MQRLAERAEGAGSSPAKRGGDGVEAALTRVKVAARARWRLTRDVGTTKGKGGNSPHEGRMVAEVEGDVEEVVDYGYEPMYYVELPNSELQVGPNSK